MNKPQSDFFEIDPEKLDEQWFRFAREYFDLACQLADARADYERAKARRDVVVAELDRDIRADPDTFGVAKITEPVVEKTVLLQKKYHQADKDVIITKHSVDIMHAAVEAMDAKKKGLENAVQLRLAGYYAEPHVRGDAARSMADAKIDRAMGRRREVNRG